MLVNFDNDLVFNIRVDTPRVCMRYWAYWMQISYLTNSDRVLHRFSHGDDGKGEKMQLECLLWFVEWE